jgi:hypothetical protein
LKNLLTKYKDPLTYLGLMMIIFGLPLSRAMMSSGMIFLTLLALLQPGLINNIKRFYTIKTFISIHAFFFLIVISGV